MRRALAIVACAGLASLALAQDTEPAQPGTPAQQSPEDRIAQLESELAKVIQERDELRVRLAEAIAMLRNLGYSAPAPVVAEPADPMASPLAAMQTLRRRARLELSSMPRTTADERAEYREAAQSWVEKMNQGLAGEKQWLVRATNVMLPTSSSSAARATATLQLFDAATGAPLSSPMEVSVPGRVGRRMADAGVNQGWTAHVVLKPDVRHNADRQERGPFDHPPFLAPEVEATVGVDWLRFEPAVVPEGFFPAVPGEDPLAVPDRSPRAVPNESPDAAPPARQPR